MPDDVIRQLYELGWSNTEIARANEENKEWHPSPSMMSRKLKSLHLPARRVSHKELIPWRINPAHAHSEVYYALQAISRERQALPLARQDVYRAQWLRDLLSHGGIPKVVDYDYTTGWRIVRARKADTDIIRRPVPVDDANGAQLIGGVVS
jgi:hypothetical protein